MRKRRSLDCRQFLHVVRYDHARHRAFGDSNPQSAVNQVAGLRRHHAGVHIASSHILEEVLKIDLLLVVAAKGSARLLPDDGEDGLVVETGIVEPVQKMDRSGAGRGHADTNFAGPFGVGAGHEGGFFFVPGLDKFDWIFCVAPKGCYKAANTVSGETVDTSYVPLLEAGQNKISDIF
jgi:hypothetical protein